MNTLWRIELLGTLRAVPGSGGAVSATPISRFRTQKTAALLAYLALHADQSHGRDELADQFWPEADRDSGRRSLRQALTSLRRQLEPPGAAGGVILSDRLFVRLNADVVTTDVAEFESLVRAAAGTRDPNERTSLLDRAAALYRGPLLPGHYDDWILDERERLDELARRLPSSLKGGPFPPGHFLPASDAAHAAPASSARAAFTLRFPATLTNFFGREDEIGRLGALRQAARLITITGPGGTGKNRLALEAARRFGADGNAPGHLCFVSLADLADARAIASHIADALGRPRESDSESERDDRAWIIASLTSSNASTGAALLILDNFDNLVEDGAPLVSDLLEQVPRLVCLVTSRRRLNVPGERELPLAPLPVPAASAEADSPAHVASFAGVRLFVDRAQNARPDFALTPRNAADVARLCARLEGIPLALELLAAWAGVLTPAQMLQRITETSALLGETGPPQVALRARRPDRQKTLGAALESSFALLGPDLRDAFVRLCVFRGGWTLEAAESLLGGTAADRLARLRERSLLVAEEADTGGLRFRMLETLRAFAEDRLGRDERAALAAAAHAGYFLALAEAAHPHLDGPDAADWLRRLDAEHDNLRAGLAAAPAADRLRLAAALGNYWLLRGFWTEGREWLTRTLAAAATTPDTTHEAAARTVALGADGALALRLGDYPAARARFAAQERLARSRGDADGVSSALHNQALLAAEQEDAEEAARLWEECQAVCRRTDNEARLSQVLHGLAGLAVARGAYDQAQALFEEVLAACRAAGDRAGEARALNDLANLAHGQGDLASAERLAEDSLRLRRDLGDRRGMGNALNILAILARNRGDAETARVRFAESLHLRRAIGDKKNVAASLNNLCNLALDMGDHARARALLEECLVLRRELGQPTGIVLALNNLGNLALETGDLVRARALFDESLELGRACGNPLGVAIPLLNLCIARARLGDAVGGRTALQESLAVFEELGHRWGLAYGLEWAARLIEKEPNGELDSARLAAASEHLAAAVGAPLPASEQADLRALRVRLRARLGPEAFDRESAHGLALSLADACGIARARLSGE